jgi:hypothetical protein
MPEPPATGVPLDPAWPERYRRASVARLDDGLACRAALVQELVDAAGEELGLPPVPVWEQ